LLNFLITHILLLANNRASYGKIVIVNIFALNLTAITGTFGLVQNKVVLHWSYVNYHYVRVDRYYQHIKTPIIKRRKFTFVCFCRYLTRSLSYW